MTEIAAEISTKINTFKGFFDTESRLYVNRLNSVDNPINNSIKAINLIVFFVQHPK